MKHTHTISSLLIGASLSVLSFHTFAEPGTQSNTPLVVGTSATPNIMFVVDNSRSMEHVAEESTTTDPDKYNSATTYIDNCSSPASTGSSYFIYINSGSPKVRTSISSGTEYTVSYNTDNDTTGTICFDPTTNYSAGLHATSGSEPTYDFTALYTGNYLNWYFTQGNTNETGGSVGTTTWLTTAWPDPDVGTTHRIKPGTQTRKIIARDSITTLVTALEVSDVDMRLGLSGFGTTSATQGAKIFDEIKYLDTTQRDSITTNLKTLGYGSGTPLARTMHTLGRYFIGESGTANGGNLGLTAGVDDTNGQYNGDLTLHPDATTPTTVDDDTVFAKKPSPTGASRESPIQYWCQSNFAVVMTDGLPTVDRDNIPSDLKDYDNDCTSVTPACENSSPDGDSSTTNHYDMKDDSLTYIYELDGFSPSDYFDDVAQALYEVDLRPDINDYDGGDVKNNIITYTIAFADQDALNNKLIEDAGTQGGGEAISASDGADLITKFTEVTNKILATTSSAASVSFNTGTLTSNTALYQALFTTSRWSGDILAFPVSPTDGEINKACTLDTTNCWSAADHLDALAGKTTFLDNRQIITFDPNEKKGIPFQAPASYPTLASGEITKEMIQDLCAGPDGPELETTPTSEVGSCRFTDGVDADSTTTDEIAASNAYLTKIVNYVRGDRTYEDISTTPTFRTRQSVLGDIVHSSPAFVGAPSQNWPSLEDASNKFGVTGNRYSDFKTAKAARTKVLYVAANDGMLHAFRTNTLSSSVRQKAGDELFAFMPSFVFSKNSGEGYHYLSKPSYEHKYYLDLSPTYADYYGTTKDSTNLTTYETATADWHTILIAGSRGGTKKGFFALNITDPLTITEAAPDDKVLWEFTNVAGKGDVDLGFTYSKPTIAMTNATKSGRNRWAAIFGNGYQNDASAPPSGVSCTASLFVVFLDGGLDGTWTIGTDPDTADYMKIDTEVGTNAAGTCNGLSTPALWDTDGDRILDRVYAGDVQGNMWAFDLTCGSTCTSSNFKVAYSASGSPAPLFTAVDPATTLFPSGRPQPIMARPAIAKNIAVETTTSNSPNLMVLFSTGKYHSADDYKGTTKINTVYGIWDGNKGSLTDDRTSSTASTSTLVKQTIFTNDSLGNPHLAKDPITLEEYPVRINTSEVVDYSDKYGWFADLDGQNTVTKFAEERVVVDVQVRGDTVFFNTAIPSTQICGSGGEGWLMGFNFIDGAEPQEHVFDANRDGVINDDDHSLSGNIVTGVKLDDGIPTASTNIGKYKYTQSSSKDIDKIVINPGKGPREGRLSWHELRPE